MTFQDIIPTVRLAARNPVDGARQAVALQLPRKALWLAFWVVVLVNVIVTTLGLSFFVTAFGEQLPDEFTDLLRTLAANPIGLAVSQAVSLFLIVHALHLVGRAFGGKGDFEGALLIGILLQAFQVAFAAILMATLLILPVLSWIFLLGGIFYGLWLASGLIMGLHGFQNRVAVLMMMFVTLVAIDIVLTILGSIVGLAAR